MPSVKTYTADVKRFLKKFPQVKLLQPWNEANRGNVSEHGGLLREPERQAVRAVLPRAARRLPHVHDRRPRRARLHRRDGDGRLHQGVQARRRPPHLPSIWGLHNYSDTNRFREAGTKAVLADTTGQVWLTETGGIAKLSASFPFNLSRQTRATAYMFKLAALSPRITRLYIFQWTGGVAEHERFDAGLTTTTASRGRPTAWSTRSCATRSSCPYKTVVELTRLDVRDTSTATPTLAVAGSSHRGVGSSACRCASSIRMMRSA